MATDLDPTALAGPVRHTPTGTVGIDTLTKEAP